MAEHDQKIDKKIGQNDETLISVQPYALFQQLPPFE